MIPLHNPVRGMRPRSWFISLLVCVVVLLLVLSRLWLGHAVAGTIDLPITLQNWKAYEGAWIDQGESISNLAADGATSSLAISRCPAI